MKLIEVLTTINQSEKKTFLQILDKYGELRRDTNPRIDKILSDSDNNLKKADNHSIVELFYLLREQYLGHIESGIRYNKYQLDLAVELFTRVGNQMMSLQWFQELYNNSVSDLRNQVLELQAQLKSEKSSLPDERKRDYLIYQNCVRTAYENDLLINRSERITCEEDTILETLARSLGLSNIEERVVTYTVIEQKMSNPKDIINELKAIGVLFFHQRTKTVYVPDEIVYMLCTLLKIEQPFK